MPNLSTDSIVQLTVTGGCFGQTIRHVRQFKVTTVSTLVIDEMEFQQALLDQTKVGGTHDLLTRYLTCLTNAYQLYDYKAQVIKPTRTAYTIIEPRPYLDGLGGNAVTANLSAAIIARGEFTGRHYRGVYKIGPLPTAASAGGVVVAGEDTALAAYAASFTVQLPVTVGGDLVTLEPCLYQAPPKGAPVPYSSKKIINTRIGYQTRVKGTRTVGRGE